MSEQTPEWKADLAKKVQAAKLVLPEYEAVFAKRLKVAKRVLIKHFPKGKSFDDWAFLLASGIATWGEIVPTLTHGQKTKLEKINQDIDDLSTDAPHWLKEKLNAAHGILNPAKAAHLLYGRQNTNQMASKVQLINLCRQVWSGQHKKEAPLSFQQETHPFSKFVGDVAAEVFKKDWSPKSAIQAYENYK